MATMDQQEYIRNECLQAAWQYFEPMLMELQRKADEESRYTHKFFIRLRTDKAFLYRIGEGQYEIEDEPATVPEPTAPRSSTDMFTAGVDEPSIEMRALQYHAQAPLYTFEQLVVPAELREDLLSAAETLQVEYQVFDEWGLRSIEPFPHSALNFHGPPGTGKTLAAHAIAHKLQCSILPASYAEIESKFHGEGPKNVKALFQAAEREHALLFIDEADSLLSKRLLEVTQGTEQAINSMRSQLFICLQEFRGIVIFATNLVENYDKAFETRVRHFQFPMPDAQGRYAIWQKHLVPQLPLASDVTPSTLTEYATDLCGRDIKNAVIDAAVKVARAHRTQVTLADLTRAIDTLKAARITHTSPRQEMEY